MKCRLLYLLLLFKVSVVVALAQNTTDAVSANNTIVNVSTSSLSASTQTTTASSAVQYSTHSNTQYVTQQPKSTTTTKVSFPVPPPRPLFPEDGTKAECKKTVPTCEKLQKNSCLGSTLPYSHTSLALINDSSTQADVQNMLDLWAGLRNAPKCWDLIQPLLCAVYMPECNMSSSGNFVYLPGKELCVVTREPCRIVKSTRGWPAFLQCDNKHFVPGCSKEIPKMASNFSGTCELPLVETENENSWYSGVDGCGIQCTNPLFTEAEHTEVHTFIAVMGSLCLVCTLFTILTFVIDWKNASRYPALILFFINACFFIGSLGWMAQFFPGARTDIVCRSDGTMRKMEPQIGSGETASCSVVFFLVYYFNMAAVTWFIILTYSWHLTFSALGSARDAIEGKRGHFHLLAWTFPLVLTITCLALTQIDGDSLSGICFVGYLHNEYRAGFVLVPISLVVIVGFFFLIRGLVTLCRLQWTSPGLISSRASAKIRDTIIRLGVFASLALTCLTITLAVHLYIFTHEALWARSFHDYIVCEANVTVAKTLSNHTQGCSMKNRPNLVAMEIHIFANFGAGIIMSSWVWNSTTLLAWKRFFRRLLRLPDNDPVKLKKHKVMAQAFSKRRQVNNGRLSLSFISTHDDPLGMKFDLNSISSMEMSSAWVAAIPRMIMRRGAVTQPRRYSDSDVQSIQSSCRQMSFECRRVSIESQISQLGISDMDDVYARPTKHKRRKHRENRVAPLAATASTTVETSHSQELTQTRVVTAEVNSTNPGIWVTDRVERKASERVESRVSERKRSRKSERTTSMDSEEYQVSEIAGSWISEMTGSWASEKAGNKASETIGGWASERVGNRASERAGSRASSRASEMAVSRASGKRSERTGSRASSKASERTGSRASSRASERTGSRASSRASERTTGSRASSRASERTGSRASSRASERTGSRASSRASDRTWSKVSERNGSLASDRALGRAMERMPRRGPGSGFSDRTPCRVPERAVGCVSDRVGGRFPPPLLDMRGSYHRASVTSVPSSPVSTIGSGVTTSGLSSLNTSAAPSVTVSLDVSSDDDDSSIENIILPDDRASTRVQPGPARLSAADLCSSYSPSFFGNNFLISGNFLRITSDSDVDDASTSTSKSRRWPLSLLHKRKKADQVVEIQLDQTLETST